MPVGAAGQGDIFVMDLEQLFKAVADKNNVDVDTIKTRYKSRHDSYLCNDNACTERRKALVRWGLILGRYDIDKAQDGHGIMIRLNIPSIPEKMRQWNVDFPEIKAIEQIHKLKSSKMAFAAIEHINADDRALIYTALEEC